VLELTLPGTPFLYAGEELGLEDAEVPADRRVDPGGRDGCRAPLPWSASAGHGWPTTPWLPWPPDATQRNVATLRADPDSILHLYRRLLAARRASPALQLGTARSLDVPAGVFAFERTLGSERRVVAVNFTTDAIRWQGSGRVEVATDRRLEGRAHDGVLPPDAAVVLCPP
jgi:alpha-glucosidase